MIWIILSSISVITIIIILWPMINNNFESNEELLAINFYNKQLEDLQKDIDSNLISKNEAEDIRIEINRRLLKSSNSANAIKTENRPQALLWSSITIALGIPFLTLIIYMNLGSPEFNIFNEKETNIPLDDHPEEKNIKNLILTLSNRLELNPNDIEGWFLLARTYREINDIKNSLEVYRNAISFNPNTIPLLSEYGEALVVANNGIINQETQSFFYDILRKDINNPRARFYIGLSFSQNDDPKKAIAIWRDLTKDAPPSAPWLDIVRQEMSRVAVEEGVIPMSITPAHPLASNSQNNNEVEKFTEDTIPQSDEDNYLPDVSSIADNFSNDNLKMIQEMVGGLQARLEFGEEDYEGWLQLGRSYIVLKNNTKAINAFVNAARLMPMEIFPLIQIANLLIKGLGPNDEVPNQLEEINAKILDINNQNPDGLFIAGLIAEKKGDYDLALIHWNNLLKSLPKNDTAIASVKKRISLIKRE